MLAKFACKAWSSVSMSTKSWPWATWMVMTVSNIRRMLESSESGGAATAVVGSTNSSAVGSPEEGGGGGATPEEDFTLKRLELALIWATFCLRKVAPIRAIMCTGSKAGNSSKPKCNKIRWIKTDKNKPCAVKLLLWTLTKDQMKRWGKLIGAFITKANKNAHLSIGMVCKWEMGQMEWQEIWENRGWISDNLWKIIWGSVPHWMKVSMRYDIMSSSGGASS